MLVIGGTGVVVYRFTSSVDIEMGRKMEQDLERAMASLDNVVDSALKEASNVKKLLNANDGKSLSENGDSAEDTRSEIPRPEIHQEKPSSETMKTDQNASKAISADFDGVGSLFTETYGHNPVQAGWYPLFRIVTDKLIHSVAVDSHNDLIAISSEDREIKIGRMSNPGTLLSVDVSGQKSISLMSFSYVFLSNGELSPCLICITSDGTVSGIKIDSSDPTEICSVSNGNLKGF